MRCSSIVLRLHIAPALPPDNGRINRTGMNVACLGGCRVGKIARFRPWLVRSAFQAILPTRKKSAGASRVGKRACKFERVESSFGRVGPPYKSLHLSPHYRGGRIGSTQGTFFKEENTDESNAQAESGGSKDKAEAVWVDSGNCRCR